MWICAKSLIELSDRSSIVGSSVSAQASSSGVRYPKPIGHNLLAMSLESGSNWRKTSPVERVPLSTWIEMNLNQASSVARSRPSTLARVRPVLARVQSPHHDFVLGLDDRRHLRQTSARQAARISSCPSCPSCLDGAENGALAGKAVPTLST